LFHLYRWWSTNNSLVVDNGVPSISLWERANFGTPPTRNPLTDRHQIWYTWLRPGSLYHTKFERDPFRGFFSPYTRNIHPPSSHVYYVFLFFSFPITYCQHAQCGLFRLIRVESLHVDVKMYIHYSFFYIYTCTATTKSNSTSPDIIQPSSPVNVADSSSSTTG